MTKRGFISVVKFDPKYDKEKRSRREIKSWGKNPMLVRARLEGDLEQLRPYWSKLRIYKDTSADYAARAIVPSNRLMEFMSQLILDIDYGSHFKEVSREHSPGGSLEGSLRYTAYSSCWSALAKLQPTTPYKDKTWGGTSEGYWGSSLTKGKYDSSPYGANTPYWSNSLQRMVYPNGTDSSGSGSTLLDDIRNSQVGAITNGADEDLLRTPLDLDEFSEPLTVLEMCYELLTDAPENIYADALTPYACYDLLVQAQNSFKGGALRVEDVLAILDELVDDALTSSQARDLYSEAYDVINSGYNIAVNSANTDLDLTNEQAVEYGSTAQEDLPSVLSSQEAIN